MGWLFISQPRKFTEVVKISGDKQGIAAEMIERMKPLYALEARLREANADHRTRKRLRQKIAWPYFNCLSATWDGEIDTNYVENKIRDIALAKKIGSLLAMKLRKDSCAMVYIHYQLYY